MPYLKIRRHRTIIYSITLNGIKWQHVSLFTQFCFCLYLVVPYTLKPINVKRMCTTISTYLVIPFYVFRCCCSLLINAVHFLCQCSKPAFNMVQLCWIQDVRLCIQLLCHLYKTLVLRVQWQTCLGNTTNVTCIYCMENGLNKNKYKLFHKLCTRILYISHRIMQRWFVTAV